MNAHHWLKFGPLQSVLAILVAALSLSVIGTNPVTAQDCQLTKPPGHPGCRGCYIEEYGLAPAFRKNFWNLCYACTGKFCGSSHPEAGGGDEGKSSHPTESSARRTNIVLVNFDRKQFEELAKVNPNAASAILPYRYDGDPEWLARGPISLAQGIVVQTQFYDRDSVMAQFDWFTAHSADELRALAARGATIPGLGEDIEEEAAVIVTFDLVAPETGAGETPGQWQLVIRTLLETPGGARTPWAPTLMWPMQLSDANYAVDLTPSLRARIFDLAGSNPEPFSE